MTLALSHEAEAFAAEVRAFLATALPENIRALQAQEPTMLPIAVQKQWHRILTEKGWGGHGLPAEVGGTGWDDERYYAFLREVALADAPRPMLYGLRMLATTLIEFGTPAQQAAHLPGIISGETMWCQAFSEPNSGSDLASIGCRATLEGDHYVINGTKIWTTEAHWADALFGIFRTDSSGRKQQGITFLMMPISSPGISIQPLMLLDGTHEVNQIFFDDVRVPVGERLGDDGDGWRIAKFLLATERLESAEVGRSWSTIARIKATLAEFDDDGSGLRHAMLLRLAELEIRLVSLDATERRLLKEGSDALRGAAPLMKIEGTALAQDLAELLMDIVGPIAQSAVPEHDLNAPLPGGPDAARFAARFFYNCRARSIYGGTTETLKNVVAKADLGMAQ